MRIVFYFAQIFPSNSDTVLRLFCCKTPRQKSERLTKRDLVDDVGTKFEHKNNAAYYIPTLSIQRERKSVTTQ